MKRFVIVVLAGALALQAGAQSKNFALGKGLEIENAILREVARNYVDTIDFEKMMSKGIESMLSTLDPYTVYIPEEEEEDLELLTTGFYGGVGALIRKAPDEGVKIVEPYEGSPAVKYGLEPGDVIISIDGKTVIGETSEQSSSRMKGQPGTQVNFEVIKGRGGDTVNIVLTRERIHMSELEYAGIIRDSIGYVNLSGFKENLAKELRDTVKNLKACGAKRLVIDLRDNGGGLMDEAVGIVSLFVPKGTLVLSSKGRDPRENREYYSTETPLDTLIPILVMVNSSSASASEITAGALQDLDRATIAGKSTFGKGLIQTIRPIPYNGSIKVTTGKYYIPSGRCVQAIDYSHRNEDGSVGHIPDSLKKEFKTKKGRSVYDGGGITPDIETEAHSYSRTAYSLVVYDIPGEYAIEYYKKHMSIPEPADFHLTDAEYEDFVKFAAQQEFDSRSAAEASLDLLVESAKQDGLYDLYKTEIDALSAKVKMDKETILRAMKNEILPLVEAEIVARFYFSGKANIVNLRNDPQLDAALDLWQ